MVLSVFGRRLPGVARSAAVGAALLVAASLRAAQPSLPVALAPDASAPFTAIVLPGAVRDTMNAIFERFNQHWNELGDVNTLTQMLGTGKPTQREFLGCLRGHVARDTLWITGWRAAHDMKQLQFAVTGSCEHFSSIVGTWHTHPYRADSLGHPLKEPGLSPQDLATFGAGRDRVALVVWDVDSLDVAARDSLGEVRYPTPLLVR